MADVIPSNTPTPQNAAMITALIGNGANYSPTATIWVQGVAYRPDGSIVQISPGQTPTAANAALVAARISGDGMTYTPTSIISINGIQYYPDGRIAGVSPAQTPANAAAQAEVNNPPVVVPPSPILPTPTPTPTPTPPKATPAPTPVLPADVKPGIQYIDPKYGIEYPDAAEALKQLAVWKPTPTGLTSVVLEDLSTGIPASWWLAVGWNTDASLYTGAIRTASGEDKYQGIQNLGLETAYIPTVPGSGLGTTTPSKTAADAAAIAGAQAGFRGTYGGESGQAAQDYAKLVNTAEVETKKAQDAGTNIFVTPAMVAAGELPTIKVADIVVPTGQPLKPQGGSAYDMAEKAAKLGISVDAGVLKKAQEQGFGWYDTPAGALSKSGVVLTPTQAQNINLGYNMSLAAAMQLSGVSTPQQQPTKEKSAIGQFANGIYFNSNDIGLIKQPDISPISPTFFSSISSNPVFSTLAGIGSVLPQDTMKNIAGWVKDAPVSSSLFSPINTGIEIYAGRKDVELQQGQALNVYNFYSGKGLIADGKFLGTERQYDNLMLSQNTAANMATKQESLETKARGGMTNDMLITGGIGLFALGASESINKGATQAMGFIDSVAPIATKYTHAAGGLFEGGIALVPASLLAIPALEAAGRNPGMVAAFVIPGALTQAEGMAGLGMKDPERLFGNVLGMVAGGKVMAAGAAKTIEFSPVGIRYADIPTGVKTTGGVSGSNKYLYARAGYGESPHIVGGIAWGTEIKPQGFIGRASVEAIIEKSPFKIDSGFSVRNPIEWTTGQKDLLNPIIRSTAEDPFVKSMASLRENLGRSAANLEYKPAQPIGTALQMDVPLKNAIKVQKAIGAGKENSIIVGSRSQVDLWGERYYRDVAASDIDMSAMSTQMSQLKNDLTLAYKGSDVIPMRNTLGVGEPSRQGLSFGVQGKEHSLGIHPLEYNRYVEGMGMENVAGTKTWIQTPENAILTKASRAINTDYIYDPVKGKTSLGLSGGKQINDLADSYAISRGISKTAYENNLYDLGRAFEETSDAMAGRLSSLGSDIRSIVPGDILEGVRRAPVNAGNIFGVGLPKLKVFAPASEYPAIGIAATASSGIGAVAFGSLGLSVIGNQTRVTKEAYPALSFMERDYFVPIAAKVIVKSTATLDYGMAALTGMGNLSGGSGLYPGISPTINKYVMPDIITPYKPIITPPYNPVVNPVNPPKPPVVPPYPVIPPIIPPYKPIVPVKPIIPPIIPPYKPVIPVIPPIYPIVTPVVTPNRTPKTPPPTFPGTNIPFKPYVPTTKHPMLKFEDEDAAARRKIRVPTKFAFQEIAPVLTPGELLGSTPMKPFYRTTGRDNIVEKRTPPSKEMFNRAVADFTANAGDTMGSMAGTTFFRTATKKEGAPRIMQRPATQFDVVEMVGGTGGRRQAPQKKSSGKSNSWIRRLLR